MEQKYDFSDLQDYFNAYGSPERNVAKINETIVIMTDWFIELGDPCSNVFALKDCMTFLINLRNAIEDVKPICNK